MPRIASLLRYGLLATTLCGMAAVPPAQAEDEPRAVAPQEQVAPVLQVYSDYV